MKSVSSLNENSGVAVAAVERSTYLTALYATLPPYASSAFWLAIADPTFPCEILVRLLRASCGASDAQGRERLVEQIMQRTQALNIVWAQRALRPFALKKYARSVLIDDLCADLHECMLRAILDPARPFWEENFFHCLYFERKHIYRTFLKREGLWSYAHVQAGLRVPRELVASLDQLLQSSTGSQYVLDIEDEGAQSMFLALERSDLFYTVLHLPARFKAVILLIFWEGRSEKETARVLGISDRTVRNRLHAAMKLLQAILSTEREEASYAQR